MSMPDETKEILSHLCDEQWSNAACCGYIILACENLGYTDKQIKMLLDSVEDMFNNKTLEQAKHRYYNH